MSLKFNIHSITPVEEGGGGGGGGTSDGIARQIDDGVWKIPYSNFIFKLPAEATDIGTSAMGYTFGTATSNWSGLIKIDCSSVTQISGNSACSSFCRQCTSLTTIDFSNLVTIASSARYAFDTAFYGCTGLTSIDFSKLESIAAEQAFNNAFWGCTSITSVTFPALNSITGQYAMLSMLRGCTSLQHVYFPALTSTSFGTRTNQFNDMLYQAASGCTVHFPSNLQSVIGSWSDVTGGFGGTNTTVLFDLPATT